MTIHKLLGKLRDSRGGTLVETLFSILVAALSVALLFTCITASVRINKIAQTKDGNGSSGYYQAISDAEKQTTSVPESSPKVTVTGTGPSPLEVTVNVNLYGGNGMYSYKEVIPGDP